MKSAIAWASCSPYTPGSIFESRSNRISTLRTLADLDRIVAVAKSARRAIVVGSSFIAMETAASLTQRGLSVTVVTPDAVPFDLQLRYVGYAAEWDEVFIEGDLDGGEFLVFYIHDERILAVAGCGRDREIAAMDELMRLDRMPTPDAVKSETVNWPEILRSSPTSANLPSCVS